MAHSAGGYEKLGAKVLQGRHCQVVVGGHGLGGACCHGSSSPHGSSSSYMYRGCSNNKEKNFIERVSERESE